MCPPCLTCTNRLRLSPSDAANLHLTPATSLIHLRPQLHHIDATAEQERLAATRGGGAAAGAAATKDVARAIHMTVKQNTDGSEEIVQETMADRLKKVQLEAWKKMRYVHEEASDSWAVAEEALYLHQPETPAADQDAGAKGKAPETDAEADPLSQPGLPDLVDKVARLRTAWDEDSLLETTSGIPRPQNVKIEISDDEPAANAPAPRPKGKGKAAATTPTARATPRGKRATNTNTNTAKAGSSKAKKND